MAHHFLGIDVSTIASKALVINKEGSVVATHSEPHTLSTSKRNSKEAFSLICTEPRQINVSSK